MGQLGVAIYKLHRKRGKGRKGIGRQQKNDNNVVSLFVNSAAPGKFLGPESSTIAAISQSRRFFRIGNPYKARLAPHELHMASRR